MQQCQAAYTHVASTAAALVLVCAAHLCIHVAGQVRLGGQVSNTCDVLNKPEQQQQQQQAVVACSTVLFRVVAPAPTAAVLTDLGRC
jgi:hypothetical protein